LGGSNELRQCNGDCILWNKNEPDLIKSSFRVKHLCRNPTCEHASKRRQSYQPGQLILTLPKREEHTTNEIQLGQQKPCSIDQLGRVLDGGVAATNIYVDCIASKAQSHVSHMKKLCCKMTPSDLTWSTNATLSTENTKLNRSGQGRRNTISLVLLRLIIILLSVAHRCILSNSIARSISQYWNAKVIIAGTERMHAVQPR